GPETVATEALIDVITHPVEHVYRPAGVNPQSAAPRGRLCAVPGYNDRGLCRRNAHPRGGIDQRFAVAEWRRTGIIVRYREIRWQRKWPVLPCRFSCGRAPRGRHLRVDDGSPELKTHNQRQNPSD